MRPLRSPPNEFEIRARARCRACGKTRELGPDELLGAASMDTSILRGDHPQNRPTVC